MSDGDSRRSSTPGLNAVVEGLADARHDVLGHAVVDLVRVLDELDAVTELLARAPR